MQLEEFFNYKNQLMKDLITTDSIVELLGDDFDNPRSAEELPYTQIFPLEYVPDTAQEGRTYICYDVDVQRGEEKMLLTPVIYIWIFTHRSKLRLPQGGLRVDMICNEICKKINGSRFYGMGTLDLFSVRRFAPATDFQGKCLTFIARDVSKYNDHNRPVPVNRRRGE